MAGVRGVGMVLSAKGGTEARNRFGACRQALDPSWRPNGPG